MALVLGSRVLKMEPDARETHAPLEHPKVVRRTHSLTHSSVSGASHTTTNVGPRTKHMYIAYWYTTNV